MLKYKALFTLLFFSILITLLPWHIKGLYGFDWTDTTFAFQGAMNVFEGLALHKERAFFIPGLNFVIEAYVFKIFSPHFIVHRNLGLVLPIINSLCLFYISYKIISISNRSISVFWALPIALLPIVSISGQQIYWTYSRLAVTESFIIAATLISLFLSKSNLALVIKLCMISLFLAVQILTKQSHGLVNLILISICLVTFFSCASAKRYHGLLLAVGLWALMPIALYVVSISLCPSCGSFLLNGGLGNSLELKGLSLGRPFEIILTIVGIDKLLFTIVFLFAFVLTSMFLFVLLNYQKGYIICIIAILGLVLGQNLINILLYEVSPISVSRYTSYLRILSHYFVVSAFVLQVFYLLFKSKSFYGKHNGFLGFILFCSMFPMLGSIVAEQMSWPGTSYIRPTLTISVLCLQLLFFIFLQNVLYVKKDSYIIPVAILAAFTSLSFFINPVQYRYEPASAGLVSLSAPAEFSGWRVAPDTARAISDLQLYSEQCPEGPAFQLAWTPIAYLITGRENATNFDLPYHDTITLSQAHDILHVLNQTPPSMLIIQPRYKNYSGVFPALGMKFLYKNLDKLIENYTYVGTVKDAFNELNLYCLRS